MPIEKKIILKFGNEEVKIFIEYAECERPVICNGRRYEIDIYFKLKSTEPKCYFEKRRLSLELQSLRRAERL